MSLIRWQPVNEMMELSNLLQKSFERNSYPRRRGPELALDIFETDEHLLLRASLPGANRDNITVEFEDQLLTVRGEVAPTALPEGSRFLLQELGHGEVSRTLRISHNLDLENSRATFVDGVLEVTLPKAQEARKRTISIE